MSSEEMILYIEGKENGKESAMRLSNRHTIGAALNTIHDVNAVKSSYKRENSTRPKEPIQKKDKWNQPGRIEKCSYCGKSGHGNHTGVGSTHIQRKLGCPAIG